MPSVIITGIAGGLGRVLAGRFKAAGYRVIGCDLDADAVDTLAHDGIEGHVVDLGCEQDLQDFFGRVSDAGPPDILVNNVGIAGAIGRIEDLSTDDWRRAIDVNLMGAVIGIRNVLAGMKARRSGAIVNISTSSVRTAPVTRGPYIVSKAALEALTTAVAREAGPFNVRCNAVRPGMMNNDRLNRVLRAVAEREGRTLAEVEREQLQYTSMRSKVEMNDVASGVLYLATESGRFVTGQILGVDGGSEWEM